MPQYNVTVSAMATSSVSQTVTVEADSEAEAREAALDELQDGSWWTDDREIEDGTYDVIECNLLD